MIFSYNCLKVRDKTALLTHLQKLHPPAILFYKDELEFARLVKITFPQMTVILRHWPDADNHKRFTPAQWLQDHEAMASGGLMLYTSNEAGFGQDVINWHVELMKLCIPKRIQLCVMNSATGTWDSAEIARMRPLLELAGQHRDLFVLGLHSYAGGVITSGLLGGNPDNAGVVPGAPGGKNLVPVENWPSPDAARNMTKFHVGRHEWILTYCEKEGIAAPRIGLTEGGFDDTSDIKTWLDTLHRPQEYGSIGGWRSLKLQWAMWWSRFTSAEIAFVEQWKWAEKALLKGVEFALFYAYGDDGNWATYNVDFSAIPALLETYAQSTPAAPPAVVSKPLPMLKPANASNPRVQRLAPGSDLRNIRAGTGKAYEVKGVVGTNVDLTCYDPVLKASDGSSWRWIESAVANGFICIDDVQFVDVPFVTAPDVPPPLPTAPPAPITPLEQEFPYMLQIEITSTSAVAAQQFADFMLATVRQNYVTFQQVMAASGGFSSVKKVEFAISKEK